MATRTLLVSALALATSAVAQTPIPLPAYGNTFTASLTRGFYFQCPVDCILSGLQVPNENMQPNQVVEVLDFGAAGPPAFPATVAGTQLFYDNTTPSDTFIPTNIPLSAGTWYGVLGACNPSQGSGTSHNSYGTPSGPFVSDILGNPTTLARMGTQSGIASNGGNTGSYWSEDAGPLSRVEVHIIEDTECFLLLGVESMNFVYANHTFLVNPLIILPMSLTSLPSFPIPNNPQITGLPVYTQSVMYNPIQFPNNPIRVSQGFEFNIGNHTTPYGTPNGLLMWPTGSVVVPPGGQIEIGFTFL